MNKYLAAGVVAIMVFAFAAFAAPLTLNGGTLQAGTANDLTCTDDDVVLTYNTPNLTTGPTEFLLGGITATFSNANCDGEWVELVVNDINGASGEWVGNTPSDNNMSIQQVSGGSATFTVPVGNRPNVEHVTEVTVLVTNGSSVFTDGFFS